MARTLPSSLASIVEELELDQPRVVTVPLLTEVVDRLRDTSIESQDVRKIAYRLQEHGWLGRLRTRDAWEFIPGARAGTHGSGDRLIELRAQLAVDPKLALTLAMESAAAMLGYGQRPPSREVIAAPPGRIPPKALSLWRVVHMTFPPEVTETRDGLPVWSIDALLAGIATRPSAYEDRPGLAQWLPDAGRDIDTDRLRACLQDAKPSTWQRCIYLLRVADRSDLAADLAAQHPPKSPLWFGARRTGGVHDTVANVTDGDLAPYLSGGTGA